MVTVYIFLVSEHIVNANLISRVK